VLRDDEETVSLSIDIIIPTYNRPSRIPLLVNRIARLMGKDDCLYVVWQGDKKPEARESPNIHFLRSSPPNLPRARNSGIAAGHGDICLFFDDDVEIMTDDILEAHRKAYSQKEVGAAAGYIDDPFLDKRTDKPSHFDETTGEIIQNFSVEINQDSMSIMGANMSFRRRALRDVGGFDEHFRANAYWEEVDCAFRVRRAGWRIFYCADARVKHLREELGGCRSQRERGLRYLYHQFANTAYFASRHAQPKYYRSWLRFWKYRLEFLSRKERFFLRHDPLLVAAGIMGAGGGILRYATRKNRKRITTPSLRL
jgi:GT2 family glycosyltransferase